ncbi:MAG: sigma 54-interacting transcriptional regulator [Deltaproteobacteria bacterium]|nr:sigma 54-interacting transcriptional regulator [Deltaproteobacteria bacterium]
MGERRLVLWVLAPRGLVEYELAGLGSCTVGRAPGAGICIDDPSISRVHARLSVGTESVTLEDLGSTNGTFVRGARLGKTPVELRPGDEGRLGNVGVEVRLVGVAATAAARRVAPAEFEARLRQEVDRALRFDRSFGHLAVELPADGAAEAAAELLAANLRTLDFVTVQGPRRLEALLAECSRDEARAAARRLLELLQAHELPARIGLGVFPDDAPSAESLRRVAELAMGATAGAEVGIARQACRVLRVGARDVMLTEPRMLKLYALVERAASAALPALAVGETGSGKEVVAEALHYLGARAQGPMIKVNCSALPETLLESELFGYERGAFSGALAAKPGIIEQADGGTLLLDEISEMAPGLQAKLLRVLEDGRVRRLGATADRAVRVRFVAATHRDLAAGVAAGTFRQDLLYRLNALVLEVPPLRERRAEILPLAEHFATEAAQEAGRGFVGMAPAVEVALSAYPWPGNVRELRNVMSRAVLVCDRGEIRPEHLPPEVAQARPREPQGPQSTTGGGRSRSFQATTLELDAGAAVSLQDELHALERARIVAALQACGGNQTRAAERLKMPRRTLVAKLRALGLDGPRKRRVTPPRADGDDPR